MNDLQTLFSVVFGIYFAATVGAVGRFQAFDTTAAAAGDWRALLRCGIAIVFLDVIPFFYFLGVLSLLGNETVPIRDAWVPGIGVLFAGLGGFGIYRVFIAVLLLKRPGASDRFVFYSEPEEMRREPAIGHAQRHKPQNSTPGESRYVLTGGVVWLAICLALFFSTV